MCVNERFEADLHAFHREVCVKGAMYGPSYPILVWSLCRTHTLIKMLWWSGLSIPVELLVLSPHVPEMTIQNQTSWGAIFYPWATFTLERYKAKSIYLFQLDSFDSESPYWLNVLFGRVQIDLFMFFSCDTCISDDEGSLFHDFNIPDRRQESCLLLILLSTEF